MFIDIRRSIGEHGGREDEARLSRQLLIREVWFIYQDFVARSHEVKIVDVRESSLWQRQPRIHVSGEARLTRLQRQDSSRGGGFVARVLLGKRSMPL